ncbi:MAG: GP88 family protein [bacterium]
MKFSNYYFCEDLPTGFDSEDVESVENFINSEIEDGDAIDVEVKDVEEELGEDIDDAEILDVDVDELKRTRLGDPTRDVELAKRPERMLHKSNIVDENGNLIDNDKLRALITKRPDKLISANTKLKTSGKATNQKFYDITLPAYQGLYVDEKTGIFKIVRTCPYAGECAKFCYATKGGYIQFPASSLGASRVVNYLMNDEEGFKEKLINELKSESEKNKKRGIQVVLRWHDSGDFLSEKYLQLAYDVAKETPEVEHYAYTKNVPLVRKLQEVQPDNFTFNFSFGGTEDETIDVDKDKHARVVPANLFKDIITKGKKGPKAFTPMSLELLKDRVSEYYGINRKNIISYDELIKLPVTRIPRWHVLVWKGHGDDSAVRRDVLGTLLLIH